MLKEGSRLKKILAIFIFLITVIDLSFASDINLVTPDLSSVSFLRGTVNGKTLLLFGFLICVFGLLFGIYHFLSIKNLPVHSSMKSISELIYGTCKTYLITQGKFIIMLEILLIIIMLIYFWLLQHFEIMKVFTIVICSIIGILGSYTVAWFGMRINTFANSRSAFSSLRGNPFFLHTIALKAGMSIGMLLISIELSIMLGILLFVPSDLAGACFTGFAIGESLGALVLRIAGGIFTKIADIGSDLMKIIFNIKEDDARNPGVIADCTGDNAGDSVGPTADGFETYGVTGVALVIFIILAVNNTDLQARLLVWIFAIRLTMLLSSAVSYAINSIFTKIKYFHLEKFNFEAPLTSLVWISSVVSIVLTFIVSNLLICNLGCGTLWWKLSLIISCGTIAGAIIPEVVKIFTSVKSAFVQNIVTSSKHGGASLNILAGLTAGNFSAYWMGILMIILMSVAYVISLNGLNSIMVAPSIFAFGLVAFGFLSMGPITIAVDSYGPVSDNAQSIYELSLIENVPDINKTIEKCFGFKPFFDRSKLLLEENDGAGNTFKATAKPVLIGTAVIGATTMIFSTIVILTNGLTTGLENLSLLHAPFLLGLIAGGAIIYWFTGASNHAVAIGAYKAVEFIKNNIKLDGTTDRASIEDSKKVVEICTKYAQKGMINLFLVIFFTTLAFAFIEPYFFIGYLISIALFGLFQAIFMANAGGAWDNAKKYVEIDLCEKGTKLYEATVVGDTVGDPFKDTASVAMNPIIKFTTLFGLLALELALALVAKRALSIILATIFFSFAMVFVIKSFSDTFESKNT
ncbi:MAG: sodium-translocating pyrophosphatase [Endomicrobium sp.]|jgi:K(+)-stimulated pyrophosphate-energized sodium pump|nr:sodium-translocating pyrophosphatase [Endomicrobium sp.]